MRKEVFVCEAEQSTGEEYKSMKDLMNDDEDLRQQEVCLTEEEIVDDFLNYWTSPNQLGDVKPCIF